MVDLEPTASPILARAPWHFLYEIYYTFFLIYINTSALASYRSLFPSVRYHLLEMATTAASSLQIATARPCISSSRRLFKAGAAILGCNSKAVSWNKLTSACHISSVQPFQRSFTSSSIKFDKVVTKAMSEATENKPISGLPIDLRGQFSFAFLFVRIQFLLRVSKFLCLRCFCCPSISCYGIACNGYDLSYNFR